VNGEPRQNSFTNQPLENTMKRLLIAALTLGLASQSYAADCNLVYDEYDSLMNKHFLLSPGWYTSVKENRISRAEYNGQQKGKFLLKAENAGYGVAVVHTNNNTWGKLLYTWSAGGAELIIKEATLYGRVMDGHAPRTLRNIRIPSSWTYDLDTGTLGGSGADIWFNNVDGNLMYLSEYNGANLTFPMNTLCN
jgi:hypothetical protein